MDVDITVEDELDHEMNVEVNMMSENGDEGSSGSESESSAPANS
jgi:hypothetical protein